MEKELCRTDSYIVELVQKYSDLVLRLAVTYLRNISDAEDVTQVVFIRLLEQRKTFVDADHEKAWLIRVTVNACKDILRSPWKRRRLPYNEAKLPIADQADKEVVELVLGLPEKYRGLVYLHYFEGYSTAETAALLNRKEATVRTQLRRAREILKSQLNGGFNDD